MDMTKKVNIVTATGGSVTPEPAVGGTRAPQKSLSSSGAESVDVLKQASTANQGVGNMTVGAGAKQACTGDRKVASATAEATLELDYESATEALRAATKQLGSKLCLQQGGLDLLSEKASHLELVSKKSQSPTVRSAIKEILEAVKGIQKCRAEVTSAFSLSLRCVKALMNTGGVSALTKREGKDAATSTRSLGAIVVRGSKDAATNTDSPQAVHKAELHQGQQQQRRENRKKRQRKQ
ncbi:uncharacterized protein LOC112680243, partial [Sipha flava]|uniref:Uncharacterized protein LOC112680243 n=1 Tax=Sipha flava TaxID=143950 RepID=A0A8B8F6C9_9HEMI